MNTQEPNYHRRAVVLSCFGRGGSSILWRMIGSSPDVVMMKEEWHQAVFGSQRRLRRLATKAFALLGVDSVEPLRRFAHRRVLAKIDAADVDAKLDADRVVMKLMDYHIVFADMIQRSFASTQFVILTRHPHGQCGSLMRSELSLEAACEWYNDVANLMLLQAARPGAITIRFEDLVADPYGWCTSTYEKLQIKAAADGKFVHKVKPYGQSRVGNLDVAQGELIRIGKEDARQHIDSSVLNMRDSMSEADLKRIWQLCGPAARKLGYEE